MRPEPGLSTTPHCVEWYKLVLRTRLTTLAVRYIVLTLSRGLSYGLARGCWKRAAVDRCIVMLLTVYYYTLLPLQLPGFYYC